MAIGPHRVNGLSVRMNVQRQDHTVAEPRHGVAAAVVSNEVTDGNAVRSRPAKNGRHCNIEVDPAHNRSTRYLYHVPEDDRFCVSIDVGEGHWADARNG